MQTLPLSSALADKLLRAGLCWLSPAGRHARLSIVLFHRVLAEPDPMFPEDIDSARFGNICAWLSAWFNVLPLDEAVQRQAAGDLPARALAITFDDGYADNHDIAMPILRAHGLCATFFIATGFLDGGRMWNDTVVESIRRCRQPVLELSHLGLQDVARVNLGSPLERRQAAHQLLGATKYLPPLQRQAAIDRIAEAAAVSLPNNLMMRSEDVRALRLAGMQVGAHTVTHPILSRLDDAQAKAEITQGKAALESLLQQPVTLFAYPNGKPRQDYLRRDVELVRDAGFEAAVSTAYGAAGPSGSDRFQLPRFTPWDVRRLPFGARMARNFLAEPALA